MSCLQFSARSSSPTGNPTGSPTGSPTDNPTTSPTNPVTYRPGLLSVIENGLLLSQGLTSRIIAQSGQYVTYSDGLNSSIPFHFRPDFGATFSVPDDATSENQGGWVYVSNSEMPETGQGGVGAIYFDKDGNIVKYEMVLTNTTMNCAGGKTPWETFVTCEEVPYIGQVYQVDPFGRRPPEILSLSKQQAGRYEAFAYDDRNPAIPRFFVTEDQNNGPTRRWTPFPESIDWENEPWDMLHGNGTLEYLVMTPDTTNNNTGTYEWIDNVHLARENASVTYPATEGIDRKDNLLYIVTKNLKMLYILDLDSNTYLRISTVSGLFDGHPDQVMHLVNQTDDIVYFNEDEGQEAGVHGRNAQGQYFTILEGIEWSIETTGLALSPSGHHMYVAFQVRFYLELSFDCVATICVY